MPVIRDEPVAAAVTAEQRTSALNQLVKELSGPPTSNGPVIFIIPLGDSDRVDVLVVWNAWAPFRSEDRSQIILEALGDESQRTAQALGVTYQEALEQQVLPYAVIPMARKNEPTAELKDAMIAEGGFLLPGDRVDLRFPTMSSAERAHRRLSDQWPQGYWSIVQTFNSAP